MHDISFIEAQDVIKTILKQCCLSPLAFKMLNASLDVLWSKEKDELRS